MQSEKLLPPRHESVDRIVGPSGSPTALLVKAATGAAFFALVTLTPTSSSGEISTIQVATTDLAFICERGLPSDLGVVPVKLVAPDHTLGDTAIDILQKLDVLEKANPLMASQTADARKIASALPSGLMVPRAWTDGESEVVLEWIKGEKHAIVSFEGDGEFGYAMRQGDRFAPGSSPNNVEEAALDDLIDYLADL